MVCHVFVLGGLRVRVQGFGGGGGGGGGAAQPLQLRRATRDPTSLNSTP